MSQRTAILQSLQAGPVCGTMFLEMRMPRYAARINELRNAGWHIVKRRCENPHHQHQTVQYEYLIAQHDLFEGATS